MQLELAPTDAVVRRRRRLAERLDGAAAVIFAGAPVPRNYRGNPFPFRASSHFLYLVGLPLEDAALVIDGDDHTLYVMAPDPSDELWHGPLPSLGAIGEATGCATRSLEELPAALAGREVATVPAVDLATRATQEKLLGRAVDTPSDGDEGLVDALIALRLVHDDAAIAELRRAAAATRAAHLAGMAATRPGMIEAEVQAAMEAQLIRRGMATSYGSIVTVHGEVLHNHAHHHRLEDGDLLLADVGAETAGGWAGDVTRTWPVNGKLSSTQRELYEVVLAANRAAIMKAAPRVRYRDVHLEAVRVVGAGLVDLGILKGDVEELVADGVVALFFPHGVGHLIGLDVHDMEDLGDRAGYAPGRTRSAQFGLSNLRLDRDLAPSMAVTIEPGFYQVPAILGDDRLTSVAKGRIDRDTLRRFADVRGIRIEDDVLITEDGREVLTEGIPKSAEVVEATVGVLPPHDIEAAVRSRG